MSANVTIKKHLRIVAIIDFVSYQHEQIFYPKQDRSNSNGEIYGTPAWH